MKISIKMFKIKIKKCYIKEKMSQLVNCVQENGLPVPDIISEEIITTNFDIAEDSLAKTERLERVFGHLKRNFEKSLKTVERLVKVSKKHL